MSGIWGGEGNPNLSEQSCPPPPPGSVVFRECFHIGCKPPPHVGANLLTGKKIYESRFLYVSAERERMVFYKKILFLWWLYHHNYIINTYRLKMMGTNKQLFILFQNILSRQLLNFHSIKGGALGTPRSSKINDQKRLSSFSLFFSHHPVCPNIAQKNPNWIREFVSNFKPDTKFYISLKISTSLLEGEAAAAQEETSVYSFSPFRLYPAYSSLVLWYLPCTYNLFPIFFLFETREVKWWGVVKFFFFLYFTPQYFFVLGGVVFFPLFFLKILSVSGI